MMTHQEKMAEVVKTMLEKDALPATIERIELKRLKSGYYRAYCQIQSPMPVDQFISIRERFEQMDTTPNVFAKAGKALAIQVVDNAEPFN